jgi:gamma-glutamylcyclotransferase (GGCT)/AIG2-like uncharacterized protein YtfP
MLLFVYGTLRRGEPSHSELGPARYIRDCVTTPCYELVSLGPYPALLEAGRDAVLGELYEVPEVHIEHLDRFEDVPALYERKPILIVGAQALGYVMRRELAGAAPRIPSGDWRAR